VPASTQETHKDRHPWIWHWPEKARTAPPPSFPPPSTRSVSCKASPVTTEAATLRGRKRSLSNRCLNGSGTPGTVVRREEIPRLDPPAVGSSDVRVLVVPPEKERAGLSCSPISMTERYTLPVATSWRDLYVVHCRQRRRRRTLVLRPADGERRDDHADDEASPAHRTCSTGGR